MVATTAPVTRTHGNAYEIFILALTLLSLLVMVLLLMPVDQPVRDTLTFYDNLICVVFLVDFAYNLTGSHPRREYFIRRRGWLDLMGSMRPSASFVSPACSASPASAGWPGSCGPFGASTRRSWCATWSRTAASTRCSSRSC